MVNRKKIPTRQDIDYWEGLTTTKEELIRTLETEGFDSSHIPISVRWQIIWKNLNPLVRVIMFLGIWVGIPVAIWKLFF